MNNREQPQKKLVCHICDKKMITPFKGPGKDGRIYWWWNHPRPRGPRCPIRIAEEVVEEV